MRALRGFARRGIGSGQATSPRQARSHAQSGRLPLSPGRGSQAGVSDSADGHGDRADCIGSSSGAAHRELTSAILPFIALLHCLSADGVSPKACRTRSEQVKEKASGFRRVERAPIHTLAATLRGLGTPLLVRRGVPRHERKDKKMAWAGLFTLQLAALSIALLGSGAAAFSPASTVLRTSFSPTVQLRACPRRSAGGQRGQLSMAEAGLYSPFWEHTASVLKGMGGAVSSYPIPDGYELQCPHGNPSHKVRS